MSLRKTNIFFKLKTKQQKSETRFGDKTLICQHSAKFKNDWMKSEGEGVRKWSGIALVFEKNAAKVHHFRRSLWCYLAFRNKRCVSRNTSSGCAMTHKKRRPWIGINRLVLIIALKNSKLFLFDIAFFKGKIGTQQEGLRTWIISDNFFLTKLNYDHRWVTMTTNCQHQKIK